MAAGTVPLRVDSEGAEVAVVDPQGLHHGVGVGQGVDIGAAEPVDPAGRDGAGGLSGDAVEVGAEDGPRPFRVLGLWLLSGQGLAARAVMCTVSRRAAIPGIIVMPCA